MSERDGAWIGDAKIAGGVDPDKNTHPLNCDTTGTLEVVGVVSVLPAAIFPVSQSGTWNVGVNNFPAVQTVQPWPLLIRAEYNGANLLVYFADAQPGTSSSVASWRIRKLTYDGNGNFVELAWPNADTSFSYVWDDRATYTYS